MVGSNMDVAQIAAANVPLRGHRVLLDAELTQIIATIRELMTTPEPECRGMGFLADIR